MTPAVHTYAFRQLPLERALDEVVRLGCARTELWLGHVDGDPARARAAIEVRRLELAAVSIGGVYRADAPLLARVGALAAALGSPRLVSCVAPGLLPRLRRALPPEVELLVENHWDQPLSGPRQVLRELAGVANAGACLDTGHALMAGRDPARLAGALGGAVRHVHLKEARLPPLWQRPLGRRLRRRLLARPAPVTPGRGTLDVAALLDALASCGFDGVLSVEFEGPEPRDALARLLAELA
jgi:sugar phosphate isomerase/epimerase